MSDMSIEKNDKLFEQINKKKRIEKLEQIILSDKELNDVIKMHQKSTWNIPYNWEIFDTNEKLDWAFLTEGTDPLPIMYEKRVSLPPVDKDLSCCNKKSERKFKEEFTFGSIQFSNILIKSFGRNNNEHKNYPSAGSLYPVIPIIIVLNNKNIPFLQKNGIYLYDSIDHALLLQKAFTSADIDNFKETVIFDKKLPSNLAIAYAIDIKRAITKYKIRGYRHALIEVGLAAQNFRSVLWEYDNLRECCWSGFSDNKLSHLLGMSPRLAPIVLLQWFGAIK